MGRIITYIVEKSLKPPASVPIFALLFCVDATCASANQTNGCWQNLAPKQLSAGPGFEIGTDINVSAENSSRKLGMQFTTLGLPTIQVIGAIDHYGIYWKHR